MISIKNLSEEPTIHVNCHFENVKLGKWTEVGPFNIWENVEFGDFSYTAGYNQFQNAKIGNFVSIASGVRVGPPHHPMDRPSVHHFTYRRKIYGFGEDDDLDFLNWRKVQIAEISHDVWLGHNAIIMPGIKIGIGAVVGSGAVVTKDVEPYSIVAGVPARMIRKRFSDDVAEKMQKIQWWYWPYELIKKRFNDFLLEPESFVNKYYYE